MSPALGQRPSRAAGTDPSWQLRHGALGRALDRVELVAPAAGDRARAALEVVLRPVLSSRWPEVALSFSSLTNTGLPVELAWASRDAAVRWTAEVAPPETPDADRLRVAAKLARRLAPAPGQAPGTGSAPCWERAQQRGTLRFGAWLGMRHTATGDAGKVYLELPDGLPEDQAARHELLRMPGLTWRMAGLLPDGSTELYARGDDVDRGLVARVGTAAFGSSGELGALVSALAGPDPLPRRSGISITLGSADQVLATTWFTFAKSLFRDDDHAGRGLLRAAAARQCSTADGSVELYRALAGGRTDGRWRHAILGVGLAADGAGWVQAGLRPT